jgi:hypothetical protein
MNGIISTNNLVNTPALLSTAGSVTNICEGDAGMSILPFKRCTKCGELKGVGEFRKGHAQCKACQSAYDKTWRESNKEHRAEYDRQYTNQNREKKRERNRLYARAHTDDAKERSRKHRESHPDRHEKWNKDNSALHVRLVNLWRLLNPDKYFAQKRNRRARLKGSGGHVTAQEWRDLKAKYDHTCLCCGKREPEIRLTQDHVKPLAIGGEHVIGNIQPLCLSCNSKKHTKTIDYR